MAKMYTVHGTFRRVEGRFQLIPSGEVHPDLAGMPIFSQKRIDGHKVADRQEGTFLVEILKGAARVAKQAPASGVASELSPPAQPGMPAKTTPAAPAPSGSAPAVAQRHATFIHPYNFVRFPDQAAMTAALQIAPFARGPAATHDRYDPQLRTGYIDCELTMHTDWFIPDPRKVHKPRDHATLGYFTLDAVDAAEWQLEPPAEDTTRPAIPASSLRGMVRSVFETATLSCLGVFDGRRLEFRATRLLQGSGYRYVPARVLRVHDEGADLQLLPSQLDGEVAGALHRCYSVTKDKNNVSDVRLSGVLAGNPTLRSGTRVVALVKTHTTRHAVPPYSYREATEVFPIPGDFPNGFDAAAPPPMPFLDAAIAAVQDSSTAIVFGYFFRTGWNIERKHDEKVFYSDENYNSLERATPAELRLRLNAFLRDQRSTTTADKDAVNRFNASMAEYEQRHRDEITQVPRNPLGSTSIQLSDFVVIDARLTEEGLVYASTDPQGRVLGLYPVSLPRVWHQDTIGDLLPPSLHPCSHSSDADAHKKLCPACRVFGWVRDASEPLAPQAVAGHVRFTHGVLVSRWGASQTAARATPLPVLGSPHPTCTEFYLRANGQSPTARGIGGPPVLTDKAVFPFPMYRKGEASLRGRKFSRRRPTTSAASADPAAGGLRRPKDEHGTSGLQDKQNQTAYLLPKDMRFSFRIYFDNLSKCELGALLFSLDLALPRSWAQQEPGTAGPLFHVLGHGTRLGMGRCSIQVRNVHVDQMDPTKPTCRYRLAPDVSTAVAETAAVGRSIPAAADDQAADALKAFSTSWQLAFDVENTEAAKDLKAVVRELIDMLCVCDGPIHYPNRWPPDMRREVEYFDSFTWFMANRRGNRPRRSPRQVVLPSPVEESSAASRLPIDPAPPG